MAKKESGNKPGQDRPFYETSAGIVTAPAYFANDITGMASMPGLRGGPGAPGSGTLDNSDPRTSDNRVPGQFFSKEGRR